MNNQQPYQQPGQQRYPQQQYQQPYQQQYPQQQYPMPVRRLSTNRSLLLFILLSALTFGIYGLIVMYSLSEDLNDIASRYDGRKTMNFLLMALIISPLTFGIGGIVWFHNISDRIGNELRRRNIIYSFGAGSYWGWGVLGALILIGPFIYYYKLFKSMNLLSESFNMYG